MKNWIVASIRILCMLIVACIWVLGLINAPNDGIRILISFIALLGIGFLDDIVKDLLEDGE